RLVVEVVDAGDRDRHVGAADLLDIAAAVWRDAAGAAEAVLGALAAEFVGCRRALVGQQAEILRLDQRAPFALLAAVRAVAAARAGLEVDVGFETHRAAMAATVIGPFHWTGFPSKNVGSRGPGRPRLVWWAIDSAPLLPAWCQQSAGQEPETWPET